MGLSEMGSPHFVAVNMLIAIQCQEKPIYEPLAVLLCHTAMVVENPLAELNIY